jgi:ABC-type transporter Mla subunit MlaD
MQEVLEQNARLVAQFPATMKSFNDALERFNQTVGRLDRTVTRIEAATNHLTGPMERVANALDPKTLREIPEVLELMRKEAGPALRAATDTQKQVALLQSTIERVVAMLAELPGAGMLRRFTAGEGGARPKPGSED